MPQAPKRLPPLKVPPELDAGPIMKLDEAQALAMLKNPASTYFQKAIACKRLAIVGKKDSIAPLAALLSDPKLAHYGRFGLEPNPDPAVDDALRAALPKGRQGGQTQAKTVAADDRYHFVPVFLWMRTALFSLPCAVSRSQAEDPGPSLVAATPT